MYKRNLGKPHLDFNPFFQCLNKLFRNLENIFVVSGLSQRTAEELWTWKSSITYAVIAYRYYYYFSRDSCGEYENVRGRSQLSLACSLQSRCCTRGMTRRDRQHPARRTQLFAILASGINSHEATMRRAYNDERIHARILMRCRSPERNRVNMI